MAFVFATCHPGAEKILQSSIEAKGLASKTLKLAYSRPGFVTFKTAEPTLEASQVITSPFAREFGVCLGRAKARDARTLALEAATILKDQQASRLHVFQSDRSFEDHPGLVDEIAVGCSEASAEFPFRCEARATEVPSQALGFGAQLGAGMKIIDVIALSSDEFWIGVHVHGPEHRPWPGGIAPFPLPQGAPSRAYLKAVEAIGWPGLRVKAGELAVDLGCAPGGMSLAFLERGLKVVGVDPASPAPVVAENPGFTWLKKQALQLEAGDLSRAPEWVCCDMNLPPAEVTRAVLKVARLRSEKLRGVLVTFKLRDWKEAEGWNGVIAEYRKAGFRSAQVTQLFNNRKEATLIAER